MEREDLLVSIASTIKDYRAGEIAEPTRDHVDRWIRQFGEEVQVPMLRELDHVFKRTYVSHHKLRELLTNIAGAFPHGFWQSAHILDVQENGNSQREIREVLGQILRERYGPDVNFSGSDGADFVYLDDAIFTGDRFLVDFLMHLLPRDAPDNPTNQTVHIMVIALHELGRYWIEQNVSPLSEKSGLTVEFHSFDEFRFENRRAYRNQSNVLWPTAEIFDDESFASRLPSVITSHPFATEAGRQLLEREFLNAGLRIRGFANNPSQRLKALGYSRFDPGFGSLFVTYRNCPNNCPLALWYGDPSYEPNHPLGRWYPLFPRKTYYP